MRRARTIEEKSEILARVLRVWENSPDIRLGQLIENALRFRNEGLKHLTVQLFFIEDDELAEALEGSLNAEGKSGNGGTGASG